MNISLLNKRALVCGSTQGIGKAVALELAEMGASVTLVARNEDALKKVLSSLKTSEHQHHQYFSADWTNPTELKNKIENYISEKKTVNILVNNTGGPPSGAIISATTEEFLQAFSNHLLCNHILVQATVDGMKSSGYGRVINIVSTSVKQPIKGLGVSNTIRAAVGNWAKTLSFELAPFGITVNNILPGGTKTDRLKSLFEATAKRTNKSYEAIENEWLKEIPMGRFAEPAEIAAAVAFLASPAASYINGINLTVDGGRTGCL